MAVEITVFRLKEKLQNLQAGNEIVYPILRRQVYWSIHMLEQCHRCLQDAEDSQGSNQTIDEAKLLQTIYNAEDIMDTFFLKTILQRQKVFIKLRPFSCLTSICCQIHFSDKMEQFMRELRILLKISKDTPVPPEKLKSNADDTKDPPRNLLGDLDDTQASPGKLLSDSDDMRAPPGKFLSQSGNMRIPPINLSNDSNDMQAPPGKLLSDSDHTRAPTAKLLIGSDNMQAPPGKSLIDSDDMQAPPGKSFNDLDDKQGPAGELLSDSEDMQAPPGKSLNDSDDKQAPAGELLSDSNDMQAPPAELLTDSDDIVGLADKEQELAKLTLQCYESRFLISVVGEAGSGKTTLVRRIYNRVDIKQHFDCRAWVLVSKDFEERDLLLDILKQIKKAKEEEKLSLELLRERLHDFLAPKKYLIVLDDVRTPDVWENLKIVFSNSLIGSGVILTLRDAEVAVRVDPRINILRLRSLRDDESWELFLKKVKKDISNTDLINLKEKILQRCRGVPLAIVVLGGLLSNKEFSDVEWSRVIEQRREMKEKVTNHTIFGEEKSSSLDQPTSSDTKQKKEKKKMVIEHAGSDEGKSNSLEQLASSDVKQKEEKEKVIEQSTFNEVKSGSLDRLTSSDTNPRKEKKRFLDRLTSLGTKQKKEKKMVIKHGTFDEGQSNSLEQSASLDIKKNKEEKEIVMEHATLNEGKSGSLDQLTSSDTKQNKDKKKMVIGHATSDEVQLNSLEQSASIYTMQNEEEKETVINISTLNEDQSNSSETSSDNWAILNCGMLNLLYESDEDQSNYSNILAMGYEDLSSPLKACLLYLGLFPKSYEIPVRRLYHLWLAEGLVTRLPSEDQAPEDLVVKYFNQLEGRNLIKVAKRRFDGSPKTCHVLSDLYDTFFANAAHEGFFHIHRNSDYESKPGLNIRRLAEYLDIGKYPCTDPYIQSLRSYISFNTRKGDRPAYEVDKFLNKIIVKRGFGLLTVLDLENVYKPVLSETLGKLLGLKYLGLRWTFLDSIPVSVGNLPCLETLDVKHTNITTLPVSIWKATMLRHLYMNKKIHFDFSTAKQFPTGSLANLQTLEGLLIGTKIPKILFSLKSLRKLGLTCHTASLRAIADWIFQLKNLQSFKLRSINEFSQPADLYLGTMNNHMKLSHLYLLGKLPSAIDVNELPPNLKNLTLSVSLLREDPMEMLGKLAHLNVLNLFARSYLGQRMTCHRGRFPQLRVLKMWMLVELEEWTVEERSMPLLRELEIRCCKKLKKTVGLENVTLKELENVTLINMNMDFVAAVKRSMGNDVYIKDEEWEFPPSRD